MDISSHIAEVQRIDLISWLEPTEGRIIPDGNLDPDMEQPTVCLREFDFQALEISSPQR
jgi:hypothetical protein